MARKQAPRVRRHGQRAGGETFRGTPADSHASWEKRTRPVLQSLKGGAKTVKELRRLDTPHIPQCLAWLENRGFASHSFSTGKWSITPFGEEQLNNPKVES